MAIALLAIACGKEALVGGSCRQGLTECGLQCVDLQQDRVHCGTCGHACTSGQTCSAATCATQDPSRDGGDDASVGDDAFAPDVVERDVIGDGTPDVSERDVVVSDGSLDVTERDAVVSDVSRPDVVLADGIVMDRRDDEGELSDGSTCNPPYDTPEHCGDCETRCADPTPLCGLQGTFKCVAQCEPPLFACGATCVNTSSDETNCGACSFVCPSGICQAGGCVGKGYGHEVVVGTDYADPTLAQSSALVTLLGNAIFQTVATAVRVLAYDEFAEPATVTRIEGWLSTMATGRGKSVTISKASDWTVIPQQLSVAQYQVLLVYDQALAPSDQMATTGTLWNAAMNAFAKGGGIVVVLDGGSAGRMKEFLTNSGLLEVTDQTDVTGTQLNIDAPTDVVGQNLPNVLAAKKTTVAFTTTQMRDNYHVFVVTDATGMLPVVVHSVPRP
jgi:hypothetical protein